MRCGRGSGLRNRRRLGYRSGLGSGSSLRCRNRLRCGSSLEVIHRLIHRGLTVGLLHRLLGIRLLHIRSVRYVGNLIDTGGDELGSIGELFKTGIVAENLLQPILDILAEFNQQTPNRSKRKRIDKSLQKCRESH